MRRIALLAIAAVLAGCGGDGPESTFPPTDTGAVTADFEPGDEVAVVLGESTAFLMRTEGGTRVELLGVADHGAIHEGSCDDRGPVAYELPGRSTEIDAQLADLLGGRFALVAGEACAELVSAG